MLVAGRDDVGAGELGVDVDDDGGEDVGLPLGCDVVGAGEFGVDGDDDGGVLVGWDG